MTTRARSLIGVAVLSSVFAAIWFTAGAPRPASAQFNGGPAIVPSYPPVTAGASASALPQPIEIQALDPKTFVVATREPRLVTQGNGKAQNMLVTVVTHYTVREDRLVPVEHVRVPTGYRLVDLAE